MAIGFNYGSQVKTRSQEETDMLLEETKARGVPPQVLPKENFVHRKHDEFAELKGAFIEINRNEISEYDLNTLIEIEELDRQKYGKVWRIWTGGIPTQEQMAAEPWGEAAEDPNVTA